MPYATNRDLPPPLQRHLPEHAQGIFREAFNHALQSYGSEDTARRVAWAAVKRQYRMAGADWVRV